MRYLSPGQDPLPRQELVQFAHDLRNLTLPILSSVELLMESEELSGPQKERLQTILRQIDRVQCLIEDVLWLAHESHSRHPVHVPSLVRDVVARAKMNCRAEVRCLFLTGGVGYVAGSESRLWRAVYNLVLNAVEAVRESGEVLVRVLFDGGAETIAVDIVDSGPGIPKEIQDRILGPGASTKRSHVGIGLRLAKQIIEEHGGALSIESQPSKGTTVSIRLPVLTVLKGQ